MVYTKAYAILSRPDPLVKAAALLPGTVLIDLTRYFCNAKLCPSVIGNVIVYRDTGHLTATFVRTLTPAIADAIKGVLSAPRAR